MIVSVCLLLFFSFLSFLIPCNIKFTSSFTMAAVQLTASPHPLVLETIWRNKNVTVLVKLIQIIRDMRLNYNYIFQQSCVSAGKLPCIWYMV